ncbi:MAG: hypothetical protein WBB44_01190 [Candidatus Nanopelagicales bacterium]|nr:hypothetical protein [Candidatus Nanopelagicales bacterium]
MFGLSGPVWVLFGVMAAMGVTAIIIMFIATRHHHGPRVPFTDAPVERSPDKPGWYIDKRSGNPRWWDGKAWLD